MWERMDLKCENLNLHKMPISKIKPTSDDPLIKMKKQNEKNFNPMQTYLILKVLCKRNIVKEISKAMKQTELHFPHFSKSQIYLLFHFIYKQTDLS